MYYALQCRSTTNVRGGYCASTLLLCFHPRNEQQGSGSFLRLFSLPWVARVEAQGFRPNLTSPPVKVVRGVGVSLPAVPSMVATAVRALYRHFRQLHKQPAGTWVAFGWPVPYTSGTQPCATAFRGIRPYGPARTLHCAYT